jgi:hypothetical protein
LYNLQPRKKTYKTFVIDCELATIDISMISAAGFVLNCQDLRAVLFLITFEKIDYKIQDCEIQDYEIQDCEIQDCEIQDQKATDQELVVQKLLAEH